MHKAKSELLVNRNTQASVNRRVFVAVVIAQRGVGFAGVVAVCCEVGKSKAEVNCLTPKPKLRRILLRAASACLGIETQAKAVALWRRANIDNATGVCAIG